MPSSISVLCQIKSKQLDGGFVNGLASYTVGPNKLETFHYGFYKKQISFYLQNLAINDYALICGKCVFNKGDLYVMISTALKIETTGNHMLPTAPHITFAAKIYRKPEQVDDDCLFGVDLLEYNNFSFANKEKMNFKIQIVFEAGPDSRFRKLPPKLEIGKLVFITGVLDLDDVEVPFVEAKEIDLLDDFVDNQLANFQTPFSRTKKFKNNRNYAIKEEKIPDDKIIFDKINEQVSNDDTKNVNNDNGNDKEEELKDVNNNGNDDDKEEKLKEVNNNGNDDKEEELKDVDNNGNDDDKEEELKEVNNNDNHEKNYANNKNREESEVITIKNHDSKRKREFINLSLKNSKMTKNDIRQKDNDFIVIDNNKKRIATRSKQKNKEFNDNNDILS